MCVQTRPPSARCRDTEPARPKSGRSTAESLTVTNRCPSALGPRHSLGPSSSQLLVVEKSQACRSASSHCPSTKSPMTTPAKTVSPAKPPKSPAASHSRVSRVTSVAPRGAAATASSKKPVSRQKSNPVS